MQFLWEGRKWGILFDFWHSEVVFRLQQKIPPCFPKQVVNKKSLQDFTLSSCSPEPFWRVTLSTWSAPCGPADGWWETLKDIVDIVVPQLLQSLFHLTRQGLSSLTAVGRPRVIFKHYIMRVGEIKSWCPEQYADFSNWLVSLQISEERTNKIGLGLVSQAQCWACAAHNQAHELFKTLRLQGDLLNPETLNIWKMFWEDNEAEQRLTYVKKADLGLETDFLIYWREQVDELHK